MRNATFSLVVFFFGLVSCGPTIDPVFLEPGISKPLAELRIKQLTKVNYQLAFDIPEDNETPIAGSLSLGFEFDASLDQPLILDFNVAEGAVQEVSIDGSKIDFEHRLEHIIIDGGDLADGYNTVDIKFTAGEVGLNRNPGYIFTLFVPDRASTVFPCFDQPDLKGTYELKLDVSAQWTAVSNGPLTSEKQSADRRIFTFERSDLISTYLFSFVAGEFETITYDSGKYPMTMYHRETDTAKVKRNAREIFEIHSHALSWLEEYTAIDYPFKKFDFVLLPSFQYGGMEHVGAIQYRASSLFLDESATPNQLLGRASLIAHETAHMWFGDMVTMRWFDDVWMKEVFANFMAAKIVNPLFPEIDHEQRFLLAHYPRAYNVDRTLGTHPIRQPLENLKQAGSLYGAIIYQKAPIVMHKLEQVMGENNFKIGLQEYLKSYAFRAADWGDLIRILDAKTAVDLAKWSNIWVETAGMPTIRSMFYEGLESHYLRFEQIDPMGLGRTWPQRIEIKLNTEGGALARSIQFNDLPVIEIPHAKDTKLPTSVEAGSAGQLYGTLDFASNANMADFPYGNTMLTINLIESPISRAAYYIQMHEFLLYKREFPPSYPVLLERYLYQEQSDLNVELLLTYLKELYWRWMLPAQREAYIKKYERLLNQLILQIDDPRLKSTLFKTLVDIGSSEEQVSELLTIWKDQNPPEGIKLSERDYSTLAFELALKLPEEASDILTTQAERITNSDQKARFDFISMALTDEVKSRDEFFESITLSQNRTMEPWVGTALHYLHHPIRADESVKYLKKSLDIIEEIQLTGDIFFPKRWLDQSFWGHQSKEAKATVEEFIKANPDFNPRLKNKILQSTDILFRVVDMHEAMKKAPTSAEASISQ